MRLRFTFCKKGPTTVPLSSLPCPIHWEARNPCPGPGRPPLSHVATPKGLSKDKLPPAPCVSGPRHGPAHVLGVRRARGGRPGARPGTFPPWARSPPGPPPKDFTHEPRRRGRAEGAGQLRPL